MNQSSSVTPSANPKALLPILLFLTVYLGNGIFFEYIKPTEGQMGFYVVSVVLAFSIALIAAFLQNRKLSFDEKIHICARGIGDDNIVIMLFIFLMAGAFSGIASEAGGASSTANLLLSIIPGKFAVPGLFLIACLISMAMGTSVGTISVLAPIACAVSQNGGLSLPFCVGVVVGGAMFGDNLSFISDTTIAATKTQGVEMKDKFRTNIKVAIPAAAITLVILLVYAFVSGGAVIGNFPFNIWQALPYFIVLGMSVLGINVFMVLIVGIALFILVGIFTGSLSYATALASMGSGISGMFETMIVTILVASIAALMKENGGFEAILSFIRKNANSKRGGMYGIAFLTAFMDRYCSADRQRYNQGIRSRSAADSIASRHLLLHRAGDHPLWRAAAGGSQYREADQCVADPLSDLPVRADGLCGDLHTEIPIRAAAGGEGRQL